MTYLSGLMLGASLANMLRQTLGARDAGAFAAQGTRGGRVRTAQSGMFPSLSGALTGGLPTSLFGLPGRTGGAAGVPAGTAETVSPPRYRANNTAEAAFTCVHASSGRRRYRTPYLTEEFANVLEVCLMRLPFVRTVRANAASGSILLIYPPEDEAHILVLAEGLEAIFAEGRTAPPPATPAQSIRRSVHDFSGWIQRHTGGALDLSSTVAAIFVLRGIRQLVLSNNTPPGSQMLWWALTLMRGWRV